MPLHCSPSSAPCRRPTVRTPRPTAAPSGSSTSAGHAGMPSAAAASERPHDAADVTRAIDSVGHAIDRGAVLVVKIRLSRHGSHKNPIYRVVVADSRNARDGRSIEEIGRYNPQLEPSLIDIDADRGREWLAKGAQPTPTVKKLLKIAGV